MRQLLKAVSAGALVCLIGLMSGCASSSLIDKWHDTTYLTPPLSKILVIAVRKDAAKRRVWEDAFSGEFATYGVAATSSYSLLPDAPPDTDQVATAVQSNGFDGVLVIRKLQTEINTHYKKGYMSMEQNGPYGPQYVPFWKRYWNDYLIVEHPGYLDTQTVAVRAIDVATTGSGGHVIWSATSRTSDPASVIDIQKEIADLVMSELARKKFIGSRK
jgi:hypothetical protein